MYVSRVPAPNHAVNTRHSRTLRKVWARWRLVRLHTAATTGRVSPRGNAAHRVQQYAQGVSHRSTTVSQARGGAEHSRPYVWVDGVNIIAKAGLLGQRPESLGIIVVDKGRQDFDKRHCLYG